MLLRAAERERTLKEGSVGGDEVKSLSEDSSVV
jgi:hypothetical protein